MKTLKLTLIMLITAFTFTSCVVVEDDPIYYDDGISLNQLLQSKDLWYIDYNATQGSGDTRFLSLAFTLSFRNGNLYANNNLVDIGTIGNGFGDQIGYYNTNGNFIEIDHDLDGFIDLEVFQTSNNRIKLKDNYTNVTYSLIGYNSNDFDYNQVFYNNIEYFLQEFESWKKTDTFNGVANSFDNENFLAFIPENGNTFQSSQDNLNINITNLIWDFTGEYEIADIQNYNDIKDLTLYYDSGDTEEFELSVSGNDRVITLYHYNSDTTYEFGGRNQIIFKNIGNKKEKKRFKVNRKVKTKRTHVAQVSNRK